MIQRTLFVRNNPPEIYKGYFDGASKGNPGRGSYGVRLLSPDGAVIIEEGKKFKKPVTNNMAEYQGLIRLLELCIQYKVKNIHIFGDSQLVIYQVTGKYKVRQPHLKKYADKAKFLIKKIQGEVSLFWIPRKQNKEADKLANLSLRRTNESISH